jgi:hypothetical protein
MVSMRGSLARHAVLLREVSTSRSSRLVSRVFNTDRSGRTGRVRYRFTDPVRPETGGIQISNQNSSSIGFHRYNDRYTGPVRPGIGHLNKKPNQWRI